MRVTGRARRCTAVTLALYLLTVAGVTWSPAPASNGTLGAVRVAIAWLVSRGIPVTYTGVEAGANVLMFVPFGVLVGLLVARPWAVVLLGAATSALIETVQLALPTRVSTVQDVVMNTLGAAVGVAALALAARARSRRRG